MRYRPWDTKSLFFLFTFMHGSCLGIRQRVVTFLPTRTAHYNVTSMDEVVIRKDR